MKSQSLGLIAISACAFIAGTVSAKAHSRKEHVVNRKFKDFVYPANAAASKLTELQVDLGYEVHEGKVEHDKFVSFRNIPFAEPPRDDLRWFEAIEPQSIREEVNDGSTDHKCPQAQVGWVPLAEEFLNDFGNTSQFLPLRWRNVIEPKDYKKPMPDPIAGVHEDCLTLDVMVPKSVWENRNNPDADPAAVIVWIYGGGFIFGWKDQFGSPEGFFDAVAANDPDAGNVIYVAMNYRLGAFGWLGGPKFVEDGGIPNLGLHDQKFALKWVQHYIESFGGASDRVTVMGQSAGASSILHHITAGGGRSEDAPKFQKAILQSPGFFPQPNSSHDDYIYSEYLRRTGATDLEGLKQLDTSILQQINAEMTYESPYGIFNFGPTVDGDYVPDLPSKLLGDPSGPYHKEIALLVGHTSFDGLLFTPPWIRTREHLKTHARKLYPGITEDALAYIDEHYPVRQYQTEFPFLPLVAQVKIANVSDFLDDVAIQCNSYFLTEAINANAMAPVFRYVFNTLPAIHGYDAGYTYYPSPPMMGPVNETLAKFSQASIVNFVRFGYPSEDESWEAYTSDNRKVMNFGKPGQAEQNFETGLGDDRMDRDKCKFWQSAPYWPEPEASTKFVKQEAVFREWL
ncbi:hypothetical protein QTJ16_001894 [Diplocarpon rosae]|uniref:Carboxylic ester hydrolase n=1 Tax=Diplocarpon rosae TaxID=946125 RepID=A0AAD9T3G3_9HELO|nr:hypothetical protein QTJ16_001894 [Diplocarpon rosae]